MPTASILSNSTLDLDDMEYARRPSSFYFDAEKQQQLQAAAGAAFGAPLASPGPRIERILTPHGHPADFSQPGIPRQHRVYGNPVPIGLTSFGYTMFLLGTVILRARGVTQFNVLVPAMVFFAGLSQTLCGWWEMNLGNTFMATIFAAYGAFSLSFGSMYLPAFGVVSAYTLADGTLSPEFNEAMGLFFIAWMVVTTLLLIASLRSSVGLVATLASTLMLFLTLAVHYFTGSTGLRTAAGVFGLLAAAAAWWTAMAGLWTSDTTYACLRVSPISLCAREDPAKLC